MDQDQQDLYWLTFFLDSGQTFSMKMSRGEAIATAEAWQTFRKGQLRWCQQPWRWRFWQRMKGSAHEAVPYVGGVGWGVSLTDVTAVWTGPVVPPPPSPQLKLQQELLDEFKKHVASEGHGEEWKGEDS